MVSTISTTSKQAKLLAAWRWSKNRSKEELEFAARGRMNELEAAGFRPAHLKKLVKLGFLIEVTERRSRKYVFYRINPDHPPEATLAE